MPNRRAAGQTLIALPLDEKLLGELDAATTRGGYSSRSDFVRRAIYEKLDALGYRVEESLVRAPLRMRQKLAGMEQEMPRPPVKYSDQKVPLKKKGKP